MPDLPTIAGGPSNAASTPGSSTGISIAADASNNTKNTTWTELIAATTYETAWLLVHLNQFSGSNVHYLVDIGVGASTAEVALIPNLWCHTPAATAPLGRSFLFPLRVPLGARISARCQCSTGASTAIVSAHAIASPISAPPSLGRVEACGVNTTTSRGDLLNDPGATPHTDSTWNEIIASTAFAYRWMCISVGNGEDATFGAELSWLLDLAVGAGGSEQPFISDLYFSGDTAPDGITPTSVCIPVAIAAGSRIAGRVRCSVGTNADRRFEIALYGVG